MDTGQAPTKPDRQAEKQKKTRPETTTRQDQTKDRQPGRQPGQVDRQTDSQGRGWRYPAHQVAGQTNSCKLTIASTWPTNTPLHAWMFREFQRVQTSDYQDFGLLLGHALDFRDFDAHCDSFSFICSFVM